MCQDVTDLMSSLCYSSFSMIYNIMAHKQLVGTGLYVTNTDIKLIIPVQQSYLPVQAIREPSQQLPKEMVYNNDARNLHFEFKVACSDGRDASEQRLRMGKEQMDKFFQQVEKIQDELNSYL